MGSMDQCLQARDRKMTQTILLLTLTSGICNVASVLNIILNSILIPLFNANYYEPPVCFYIVNFIFEAQFAVNFLVYALKNDQYRNAYKTFWKFVTLNEHSINNTEARGKGPWTCQNKQ